MIKKYSWHYNSNDGLYYLDKAYSNNKFKETNKKNCAELHHKDCACPPGPAGPPGPQGDPGPAGPPTLLTTYGDAFNGANIYPSKVIEIPLDVMLTSSNTTLTDKGIIVPTKGVYEIEFTIIAFMKPQSRLILDFMVNGLFLGRNAGNGLFNPTSTEIEVSMNRSILHELAAGDEVSIGVSIVEGDMILRDPNLKIIKIDD
ncbi:MULTISPECIES: hypothetical protein [Priestia]|uniref:hypothetical protein n=1 Tax=Priestia TaxID=2800373 RepID=UPI001C8D9286|nr:MULTISPECIES: hypothetical protein [Priestia]MBX9985538.1 hypothetical protein [Priestia aryabhattai]UYV55641.1 hypothetical protein OHU65_26880 [Priestia megaterium]